MTITLIVQVVAAICLAIAGFGSWRYPSAPWHHYGWIGMFLWLVSLMIGGIELHQVGR
jgi:hypothetical protein